MNFETEAARFIQEATLYEWDDFSEQLLAMFLRRAYEAGAADALVKKLDAIVGDDWAPVTQEGA